MTQIFDTHCHYNLPPIYDHWRISRSSSLAAGVAHAVIVGTNLATSQTALELRAQDPDYFRASIGLHPDVVDEPLYADNATPPTIAGIRRRVERLRALAQTQVFDAWGEMGLDFFRHDRADARFPHARQLQLALLYDQLRLAREYPRPIIFHVRDDPEHYGDPEGAYHSILLAIHECQVADLPLIFHCFSGDQDYLTNVLELPHSFISFAGNLTFKSAHTLRDLAARVPADRFLLETDSPFLSPEPVRGRACEPAFIRHTADFAASVLGVDLEKIYQNSVAIFGKSEV